MIPLGRIVVHLIVAHPMTAVAADFNGPVTFTAGDAEGTMTLRPYGATFVAQYGLDLMLVADDATLTTDTEPVVLAPYLAGRARILVTVPTLAAPVPGTVITFRPTDTPQFPVDL